MSTFSKAYQPVEGVVLAMEHYLGSIEPDSGYEVRVYPYQNGRECGFTFAFWKGRTGRDVCWSKAGEPELYWCFYVAECRNTDQIVIIPGIRTDWHDGMSEEDYKARRFVPWGDYMGAVKMILSMVGMERVPQEAGTKTYA